MLTVNSFGRVRLLSLEKRALRLARLLPTILSIMALHSRWVRFYILLKWIYEQNMQLQTNQHFCFFLGIGGVPDAALAALSNHKDLGKQTFC